MTKRKRLTDREFEAVKAKAAAITAQVGADQAAFIAATTAKIDRSLNKFQALMGEILARGRVDEVAFIAAVAQRLPWFDGSLKSWARLRAMLTMKLGENLDYWLDRCNEPMLLGFVDAIAGDDDSPLEFSEPMTRKAIADELGVSEKTVSRLRKQHPELFQDAPGRMIRVRLDAIPGHQRDIPGHSGTFGDK